MWTPIRYVTHHFRDRRGAALLRHRNRAATTVLVCEQKPYRSGMVFVAVQQLSDIVWTPIWYVTSPLRDRCGAALLRQRNRASTTVLVYEQKPYRSGMIFVAVQQLSDIVWTPIWYVTHHFRDRCGADSLSHRNRAATTFLGVNRSPIDPEWFSWRCKSYRI